MRAPRSTHDTHSLTTLIRGREAPDGERSRAGLCAVGLGVVRWRRGWTAGQEWRGRRWWSCGERREERREERRGEERRAELSKRESVVLDCLHSRRGEGRSATPSQVSTDGQGALSVHSAHGGDPE